LTVPAAIRPTPAYTDASSWPAERPPASVVICAYTARRLAILEAAASAAREQLRSADELIVVVDHNPELLDAVRALLVDDDPRVRVISNRNRLGLSGARNSGVATARGELIAFLDDDAVPEPGWLEQLLEPFADPEVIGTGGVATPVWEHRPPAWLPEEFLWVMGCSYRGLPDAPAEIRNPIGANMAFRRDAIAKAGGFADGIGRVGHTPLGCEETEFAIRAASRTGGRVVQQPTAAVGHLVTADRLSIRYFARRCWAEGISKAFVAKLAGSGAALASERRYATRTLPAAVLTALRAGFVGDRAGFKRAAAIVAGLLVTVAGYLRGSARSLETLGEHAAE
jgi:GT2 family glycosyltransferase